MDLLDWAALIVGAGLIWSGWRAIRQRRVNVPEERIGASAVRLGWLWIAMGALFVLSAAFDLRWLKALFRLFLQAEN